MNYFISKKKPQIILSSNKDVLLPGLEFDLITGGISNIHDSDILK